MKRSVPAIISFLVANSAFAQGTNPPAASSGSSAPPAQEGMAPAAATTSAPAAAPATGESPGATAPSQNLSMTAAPTTPAMSPVATPNVPAAAAAAPGTPAPAEADEGPRPKPLGPMKIELPNAIIKFGFLLQPQYEAVGAPALNSATSNIFLRRTRILIGATFFKNFEFFFDTDYPNLNRAANNGFAPPPAAAGTPEQNNKATPGMNIQDAFGTVKVLGDMFKIDMGYMLPPLAHNAVQGATTLYSWDYFNNSFRHSNVFHSTTDPIGRDTGVQLRGLILNDIIEYRVGMFQGKRDDVSTTRVSGRNMFRVAGRLQINLLDPETGFFYAGSYLGAKRVLSFGVSYDFQDNYHHSSGDGILDMPLGPGVLTAQVDVSHWNGGTWLNTPAVVLGRQSAFMSELGYLINAANLSPIFRFEKRWINDNRATAGNPNETRWGGGLAFWPYGHNFNLKAFYTRVVPTYAQSGANAAWHDYNQANIQAQFYIF
jgi:hypothetical protein